MSSLGGSALIFTSAGKMWIFRSLWLSRTGKKYIWEAEFFYLRELEHIRHLVWSIRSANWIFRCLLTFHIHPEWVTDAGFASLFRLFVVASSPLFHPLHPFSSIIPIGARRPFFDRWKINMSTECAPRPLNWILSLKGASELIWFSWVGSEIESHPTVKMIASHSLAGFDDSGH